MSSKAGLSAILKQKLKMMHSLTDESIIDQLQTQKVGLSLGQDGLIS